MYQDGTSKHLFSYYYMDLIDWTNKKEFIFIGMTNTTYAPSITHITDKHICMYPLKHKICGRESVCKREYDDDYTLFLIRNQFIRNLDPPEQNRPKK